MQNTQSPRSFRVHAREDSIHHAKLVIESSFEAAAVAYLEHNAQVPVADGQVRLIVREVESGHEHCFCIDLDGGDIAPCG